MNTHWKQGAKTRYDSCIRDTLNWILARKPVRAGLLNTKVDPLSGNDYGHHSGLRSPDFTHGWIQGRGLEALVSFARYFHRVDEPLSVQLNNTARLLYEELAALQVRDGHVYFLYDKAMQAIRPVEHRTEPQVPDQSIFTYSDAFAAKGLFAASCHFEPAQSERYLEYLMNVVAAIEDGRFQMDETQRLSSAQAGTEPDDFGPRMILLGAAGVLHRNYRSNDTAFADRFIRDVLDRYFDPASGLLLNVPNQNTCNVGHAIEFCGFAFEHLDYCGRADDPCVEQLALILERSLEVGLQGPGIVLSLSANSGEAESPYYPWWPMPEAIRACALGMKLSGNSHLFKLWQKADDAFFTNYWQASQCFAYQTRTVDGPVDFVPATPDLDPGYHTGLSLLSAIKSMGDLQN